MSGPIVLLYKGGEHATGAPDLFHFLQGQDTGTSKTWIRNGLARVGAG